MMWLWIGNTFLHDAFANEDNNAENNGVNIVVPAQNSVDKTSTVDANQSAAASKSTFEALFWKGRFHIEGFSFKGAVPGQLVFGPNNQLQFSLMRPSGLPIMSLTVLENDVCVLFDLDGVQYHGSHEEFLVLTEEAIPAETIHLIFKPNKDYQPDGWVWYSTPRIPIRALDVDTKSEDFLNAGYKGWRRKDLDRGPGRIYVHLGPNEWTLRANIHKRSTTIWEASCEVDVPNANGQRIHHGFVRLSRLHLVSDARKKGGRQMARQH